MKLKAILVFFPLLLSCQGPWSYYPEDPGNYRGIWITAYLVSGRPVKNVCLEKMHDLNEVYMRGFAFYDQVSIEIKGPFNGRDTSIFLKPDISYFAHNPNCFLGDENLIPEAGANYDMYVSVTWDSAGKKTTSEFSAKTHIPKKFKIKRAYDLLGEQFKERDVIKYLPTGDDNNFNSLYFVPEYSNEDIGGALVSMIYDTYMLYWGENFMDEIANQFTPGSDTALHAQFGDRQLLYTAANAQIANMNKDIDSIPVLGLALPASGDIKLLFYATTREYMDYQNTFLQNYGDSRVKPIYNIKGGAGIFAGMLVDTFDVSLAPAPDVKMYSYSNAQDAYCRRWEMGTNKCQYETRRQCIEIWDAIIWCEIYEENPADPNLVCNYDGYAWYNWYDIPPSGLKKVLSMENIITWCGFRDFPIEQYSPCGSAMVHFFRSGKKSPILEREVKKWCKEHKDDAECLGLVID